MPRLPWAGSAGCKSCGSCRCGWAAVGQQRGHQKRAVVAAGPGGGGGAAGERWRRQEQAAGRPGRAAPGNRLTAAAVGSSGSQVGQREQPRRAAAGTRAGSSGGQGGPRRAATRLAAAGSRQLAANGTGSENGQRRDVWGQSVAAKGGGDGGCWQRRAAPAPAAATNRVILRPEWHVLNANWFPTRVPTLRLFLATAALSRPPRVELTPQFDTEGILCLGPFPVVKSSATDPPRALARQRESLPAVWLRRLQRPFGHRRLRAPDVYATPLPPVAEGRRNLWCAAMQRRQRPGRLHLLERGGGGQPSAPRAGLHCHCIGCQPAVVRYRCRKGLQRIHAPAYGRAIQARANRPAAQPVCVENRNLHPGYHKSAPLYKDLSVGDTYPSSHSFSAQMQGRRGGGGGERGSGNGGGAWAGVWPSWP